jgi:hypothetical protein
MKNRILLLLFLFVSSLSTLAQTQQGSGSVSLTTPGTAVTQDFNTLAVSGTTNSLPASPSSLDGWYFIEAGGNNTYRAGTGTSNQADTYSFGASANSDRALGTLRSSTTPSLFSTIGSRIANNTGAAITELTFSFAVEQWRRGNNTATDQLTFQYSLNATSLSDGTWTEITALTATSPINNTNNPGVSSVGLDGNIAANRIQKTALLSSLNLSTGQSIWIRWLDFNAGSQEDGLTVDDFSVTPNPAANRTGVFIRGIGTIDVDLGDGGYDFEIGINNPSATAATTVDFVFVPALSTGTSADIDNFTSQTLTFPAGSSLDQIVSIFFTTSFTGDKTFTFQLQNPSGGNNAQVVSPTQIVLTIKGTPASGGYYRTISSGNWSNPSIWQTSPVADFSSGVAVATGSPSANDLGITIRSPHTVTINSSIANINKTVVDSGGNLVLATGSLPLTNDGTANPELTLNGILTHNTTGSPIFGGGTVLVGATGLIDIISSSGNPENYAVSSSVIYSNGSVYRWSVSSTNFPGGTYFPSRVNAGDRPVFITTGNTGNTANTIINGSLQIASGLFLAGGSSTLTLSGNFTNNGSFGANGSTVVFNGTALQTITGNNATFANLTANNTAGVSVESTQSLSGALTLGANALFDADGSGNNQIFTLLSTASGDARIAAVPAGAVINGSLTVQRYLANPIASRRYRYLASPVINTTVADWKNEMPITGDFADPTPAGSYDGLTINPAFKSLFYYNETATGNRDQGYVSYPPAGQTSSATALSNGTGYSLFIRRSSASIPTITLDVRGIPRVGNVGLPYTFTDDPAQPNSEDGWNLLGNPYPAPISWPSIVSLAAPGLSNTVYLKDNVNISGAGAGNYITHNGTVGTNGFTGNIASGQGFFVQATASGTLNLTESIKSNASTFYRTLPPDDLIRIVVKDDTSADEAVVYFDENATDGYDSRYDARKWQNDRLNLFSYTTDSTSLAINVSAPMACKKDINLALSVKNPGKYSLDFSDFDRFAKNVKISLRDTFANKTVEVKEGSSYTFQVTADVKSQGKARFKLAFERTVNVTQNENVFTSDNQTGNQWFKDGVAVKGATGSTFVASENGTYFVQATSGNCIIRSKDQIYRVTGIESLSETGIQLYPNPTDGKLYIVYELVTPNAVMPGLVVNASGRTVKSERLQFNEQKTAELDAAELSSGLYLLKIGEGRSAKIIKFIKQ